MKIHVKALIKYISPVYLTVSVLPCWNGGFCFAVEVLEKWFVSPNGEGCFFFPLAIDSITMIYRDTLKVNYVVNACPLGRQRITGKKCKKFEIPNSKGWQENMVLFFYE